MNKKHLIIIADYGLDDAVATVHLLEHAHMYSAIDILTVAGNSPSHVSSRNLRVLLSNMGTKMPHVRLVNTDEFEQNYACLPSIHGEDGMGDILHLQPLSITELQINEWLNEIRLVSDDIIVASLGPCTITKHILQVLTPSLTLIMGGLIKETPNFNGYEFNHYLDIPAFDWCIKQPNTVVATLDTCRQPIFNLTIPKPNTSLKNQLINCAISLALLRHPDNCYIYDYIAVQYLTNKAAFTISSSTNPQGLTMQHLNVCSGEVVI